MLEGVVARLLNQWLGKYILDLDTENLNVGIFSGHVQLTELRLKPEALYELDLPIQVTFGTIGKISIQIPWNALLNQTVVIHVDDVHILAEPIFTSTDFDAETEKRLSRAFKRKILSDMYIGGNVIGGPKLFPEHLITSIINNFQIFIQNVHIRYEDRLSNCLNEKGISAGLCISSITAETTNNKWKASNTPKGCQTGYHLLKIESFSMYWNYACDLQSWDWKTQYYLWRNTMTNSLQTFSMNNQEFDFLIKPMSCKMKFIINKSNGNRALKLLVDIVLQDFIAQMSRDQYRSICAVMMTMDRMRKFRQFLHLRPKEKKPLTKWWRYCFNAVLENRVRPYQWTHMARTRANYRLYRDTYKQLLLNPHDTELKLDLQKYEDKLSLVNIIIAREHARVMLEQEASDCVNSPLERNRSFWSMLPSPERAHLYQMIGYIEKTADTPTFCQYAENKFNVTVSNVSLSLTCDGREVLVMTLTQLLAAGEIRSPMNTVHQLSARAEGLVVEGASLLDHLTPLISAQHHCNGSAITSNVFSMDFQTLVDTTDVSYKLWCCLEAIEVTFYTHAIAELLKFFKDETIYIPMSTTILKQIIFKQLSKLFYKLLQNRVDLNVDIKVPYFVIPEFGSMTQSGNMLVVDLGRLLLRTELAQVLEGSDEATLTQMEVEERAYSRLLLDLLHAQLLFCDSAENWRDARRETDTDLHLLARLDAQVICALCERSEPRLPYLKLNASIASIKINVVERKLDHLLGYLDHLREVVAPLLPYVPFRGQLDKQLQTIWIVDDDLMIVRNLLRSQAVSKLSTVGPRPSIATSEVETEIGASDCSEESTAEAWARRVDLPGLEDNISPHNTVRRLARLMLGELCILLSRSSERIDRPYLMLRVAHAVLDIALLDYGPALQLSIRGVSLTDKLHTGTAGQYLDLIHAPEDALLLLYRHVRADCPDFRSHFYSVEHSLVADVGPLNILVHRDAIRALVKYFQYLHGRVQKHSSTIMIYMNSLALWKNLLQTKQNSPPVPPGAVKFSQSLRITNVIVKLCGADRDLLEIRASGFEFDVFSRANERQVLRIYLASVHADHLTDITLYPRVLTSDDDKLFELKYVRNSVGRIGVVEGSVRLHIGRVHITLLYTLLRQLHHFIRPLLRTSLVQGQLHIFANGALVNKLHLATAPRLHLAIDIHGPTLLLPQKTASPNLLVVHTGELNVENFFKESALENILIRLEGVTVLRAVMTLAGTLEMQEAMLEPLSARLDVKRTIGAPGVQCPRPPTWELHGFVDLIRITLAQRDLATIIAVYTDNINEAHFVDFSPDSPNSPPNQPEDQNLKCLEAFFYQTEIKYKDVCVRFDAEGVLLLLFSDCDEMLSSPIRDLSRGLCRLEIGDTLLSVDLFTDISIEAKFSVQTISVMDVRAESNATNKTIFCSRVDEPTASTYQISVSSPPVLDVSFHQTTSGDRFVDGVVERISLMVHAPLLAALMRFILDALPPERRINGGCINHGYVVDLDDSPIATFQSTPFPPNNASTTATPGLTIAIRMCKPELHFLADAQSDRSPAFVAHTELLIDYSRHSMRESLIISLSNFQIFFDNETQQLSESSYIFLQPCDIEFSRTFKAEDGVKSTLTVSNMQVHVCPKVCHTLVEIMDDIQCHLHPPPSTDQNNKKVISNMSQDVELEDLWSPKKLSGCYVPEILSNEKADFVTAMYNHLFIASVASVTVVLELELPVILIQSAVEISLHNCLKQLHGTIELQLQMNYLNEHNDNWEPLIEPVVVNEGIYRPWQLCIRVNQMHAQPVSRLAEMLSTNKTRNSLRHSVISNSSGDESSDGGMTFLRPTNVINDLRSHRTHLAPSLAAFLDETSDSDVEDGSMERLGAAICDLFTGDWNESEDSECAPSTASDVSDESEKNERRVPRLTVGTDQIMSNHVLVHASDLLHITITTQTIQLLTVLLEAYMNRSPAIMKPTSGLGSFTLHNDIGPGARVELILRPGNVVLYSKTFEQQDSLPSSPVSDVSNDSRNNEIPSGVGVTTDDQLRETLQFPEPTRLVNVEQIGIHLPNYAPLYTMCPRRTWRRCLRLQSLMQQCSGATPNYVVVEHLVQRGGRCLQVAGPLRVRNETAHPLAVLCARDELFKLQLPPLGDIANPFDGRVRIAVLGPHDEYCIPLPIAYNCRLFVQPAGLDTAVHACTTSLWWLEMISELGAVHDLICEPKLTNSTPFTLRVVIEKRTNNNIEYIIRLLPPFIIRNCLPCGILLHCTNREVRIDASEYSALHSVNVTRTVRLQLELQYFGLIWRATLVLTPETEDKLLHMATDHDTDGGNKQLTLCVRVERLDSCQVQLYAPYWLLNKTGLPLQLRTNSARTVYDVPTEEPLLLANRRETHLAVRLRAFQSAWSAEFRLEAAGTTGLVVACDRERCRRYPILLCIELGHMCPKLTHIVTLAPNHLIRNQTPHPLRFMEENERADLWLDLQPGVTVPLWPETSSMYLRVKHRDSSGTVVSQRVSAAYVHRTVLRTERGGAICVDVCGGGVQPLCVTFRPYHTGAAPVRIDNFCTDLHLKLQQRGQGQVALLAPKHSLLYTWDDPCSERVLFWNVYNNKGVGFPLNIHGDGYGQVRLRLHTIKTTSNATVEDSSSSDSDDSSAGQQHLDKVKLRRDKVVVYWSSYMDFSQRTVLFTQEVRTLHQLAMRTIHPNCNWELSAAFTGINLSLCVNEPHQIPKEIALISASDTPALWEVNIAHKWKLLTLELAAWLEDRWRAQCKRCQLRDCVQVDLERMQLLQPFFGELRRTQQPAVWLQLRCAPNRCVWRAKIMNLQIDSTNSRLLNPLRPTQARTPPLGAPCLNLLSITRHEPRSGRLLSMQIFKLHLQDFILNLDYSVLMQLVNLFGFQSTSEPARDLRADMNLVYQTLAQIANNGDIDTSLIRIERVHIESFVLHLTVAPKLSTNIGNQSVCSNIFDYIFHCLETIDSNIPTKQIKYTFNTFEVKDTVEPNIKQLFIDLFEHYRCEFLQQFHVHSLGQEVLLNPIYNPSNSEVVDQIGDGLSFGVCSGNDLDVEACITVAVELEKNYRILLGLLHGAEAEPRPRLRPPPVSAINSSFPAGLLQISHDFQTGVPLAFANLSMTSCGGNTVETFFRSSGKALGALMTKGAVGDCVAVATDALRRAAMLGERVVMRLRLPRCIQHQIGLRPYSLHAAMGQQLLSIVADGRYSNSDTYWAHGALDSTAKNTLLITLQHVFLIRTSRQWGPWDIEWVMELDDIFSVPRLQIQDQKVQLTIEGRPDDATTGNNNNNRIISGDPDSLAWLRDKLEQALVISMDDKYWTTLEH